MSRAGKKQLAHYTRTLKEFDDPEAVWTAPIGLGGDYPRGFSANFRPTGTVSLQRQVTTLPSVFHATMMYSYHYASYQAENARLLATLDALGLNLNPVIIWNAIPWTFVIDWVVGVNRFLNSCRTGWMDPQTNIHRFCWSIKRQRRVTITKKTWWELNGYAADELPSAGPLGVVEETAYRRRIGLPSACSLFMSGLDSGELTLAAALVVSRHKQGRHRH